jgi:DNA-binding NarL/FixJ family response regulator
MFGKKKTPGLIFIVEDNPLYAKTLQAYLQMTFHKETVVETFPIGELCLENLHRKPDFVIMDYYLNSKFHDAANGIEMAKQVKSKCSSAKIIVLSSQEDMDLAFKTVEQLKYDYVMKNDYAYENVGNIITRSYK